MEYILVIEGQNLEEIGKIERRPEDRPHPGDLIKIKSRLDTTWKIMRSVPSSNPDNVTVTYVVEDVRDILKIAGGSIPDFNQYALDSMETGLSDGYLLRRSSKF